VRLLALGSASRVELCVWHAVPRRRLVALKVLNAREGAARAASVERAALEAVGAIQPRCPFIVELVGAFVDESARECLALRVGMGGPLYAHVRASPRGRFGPNRARQCIAEVAAAIDAMHGVGWAHRDVKASNVILRADGGFSFLYRYILRESCSQFDSLPLTSLTISRQGHALLCDLGQARYFSSRAERSRSWVGTPHAMAPEIVLREEHGFAADWWSLGVLLFEVVTGRFPFAAEGEPHAAWREGAERALRFAPGPGPAEGVAPSGAECAGSAVEPACRALIGALLRREPNERLASVAALLRAEWYAGGGGAVWNMESLRANSFVSQAVPINSSLRLVAQAEEEELLRGGGDASISAADGGFSFMYRYILRESCSQFDSLPLTSLTISQMRFSLGSDVPLFVIGGSRNLRHRSLCSFRSRHDSVLSAPRSTHARARTPPTRHPTFTFPPPPLPFAARLRGGPTTADSKLATLSLTPGTLRSAKRNIITTIDVERNPANSLPRAQKSASS
jgi:serine/threonine protein kinase